MKEQIRETIENIFRINLKVEKTEEVIVFTDKKSKTLRDIAKDFVEVGKRFTPKIKYIEYNTTGNHGIEPPEILWLETYGENILKRLKQKRLLKPLLIKKITEEQLQEVEKIVKKFRKEAVNIVVALSYYSTTHTRFRDLLTRLCGTRYASMPLFDRAMLKGAMRVDWNRMLKRTRNIAREVNKCENIEIKTPNGTHLAFSKKEREVKTDTGVITEPGAFSNLPAGEVFLAPLEGTARGRLVLEWAPKRKLKRPIILVIENGAVSTVEGVGKYADSLRKKLSERAENRNIAELGIGTNDKASRPDNILESEKIFGTIHIALGDNSSFGGKVRTPFHQDFVFFKPTVTLIFKNGSRKVLMKDGKPFYSFNLLA